MGRQIRVKCKQCKQWVEKPASAVNRARKIGAPLYCGKKCFGLARQKDNPKTPRNPNWKQMKADYDRQYREKNYKLLQEKKKQYFKEHYNPIEAAKKRKLTMPRHVEYCRQPKYKLYKVEYDRERRKGVYGEFAEAYALLLELNKEIKEAEPNRFERYRQSGRHQWNLDESRRRRRD